MKESMRPDRALNHNHQQVIVNQPPSVQRKYDAIVEIIRANPGISGGNVAKQYYPPTATGDTHKRMQGMLLSICYSGRIECIDNCYFIKPKT